MFFVVEGALASPFFTAGVVGAATPSALATASSVAASRPWPRALFMTASAGAPRLCAFVNSSTFVSSTFVEGAGGASRPRRRRSSSNAAGARPSVSAFSTAASGGQPNLAIFKYFLSASSSTCARGLVAAAAGAGLARRTRRKWSVTGNWSAWTTDESRP